MNKLFSACRAGTTRSDGVRIEAMDLDRSRIFLVAIPGSAGDGMRRFAEFRADERGEPSDRDAYPLVEYAPRYEFNLHPGDVLFFPAWMWHKTINLNEEGLGITCRYTAPAKLFVCCPDFLSGTPFQDCYFKLADKANKQVRIIKN